LDGPYSDCWTFWTAPFRVARPRLSAPQDGQACIEADNTLTWDSVLWSRSYRVRLGTACGEGREIVVGTELCSLSDFDLEPSTQYYWQVKAHSLCGSDSDSHWGECRSFRSAPDPVGPPPLLKPDQDETCQTAPIALAWTPVSGASSYEVMLGTSCDTGEHHTLEAPTCSLKITDVTPATQYFWRVMARNACGIPGEYSDCWGFWTAPAPLDPPIHLEPADGVVCQPTSLTLRWRRVPGALRYKVRLGTECGDGRHFLTWDPDTSLAVEVDSTASYSWQVMTRNSCGISGEYSECETFSTVGRELPAPQLLSPQTDARGQGTSSVLHWSTIRHASGYRVQLGKSPGSGPNYDVEEPQYLYSRLHANTQYFWRVCTRDNCGRLGNWSVCDSFSTASDPMKMLDVGVLSPNPARDRISFGVTTGAVQRVQVMIFDSTGRLFAVVLDEILPGGPHDIVWDGMDDHGRRAASGIYQVRVTAGGRSISRCLVLLR